MDWFIFCPIRGLYFTCPDDHNGEDKVLTQVKELLSEIKREGYKEKDIIIIRGERKLFVYPKTAQLIDIKAE